eukprot:365902-Chlamydomonas_euryale.AAC.2
MRCRRRTVPQRCGGASATLLCAAQTPHRRRYCASVQRNTTTALVPSYAFTRRGRAVDAALAAAQRASAALAKERRLARSYLTQWTPRRRR